MKSLYDILREKEGQLRQLEKEVEAVKIALRLQNETAEKPSTVATGQSLSQPQMIRTVLLDQGKPMHVGDIAKAIKRKFDKRFKTTYLSALFYRYMKRGKLFYKADKPGTFGLLEWQVHMVGSPATMVPMEGRKSVAS